jgi:hypothetical protein
MPVNSVPRGSVVSCHLESPLDDESWRRFDAVRRRVDVIALIRPPDPEHGEDEATWLDRARTLDRLGLHTHWTSPSHARPTGGDPAARVRRDYEWVRGHGLEPRWFCGGGWYTDAAVQATVAELGMVDCTPRDGPPRDGVLPTTHSLGRLARAVLTPALPAYVHAYFHDYDLLDVRRRTALRISLGVLGMRRSALDASSIARKSHGTR